MANSTQSDDYTPEQQKREEAVFHRMQAYDYHKEEAKSATTFDEYFIHRQWMFMLEQDDDRMLFARTATERARQKRERERRDHQIHLEWGHRKLCERFGQHPQSAPLQPRIETFFKTETAEYAATDPRPPRSD